MKTPVSPEAAELTALRNQLKTAELAGKMATAALIGAPSPELAALRKRLADVEAELSRAVEWVRDFGPRVSRTATKRPYCGDCGTYLDEGASKGHGAQCAWAVIVGHDWAAKHSTGTESQ